MFGTHDLTLFILAGLLLNITPGPDTFFIMSRSATGGVRAGSVAALGICTGVFVHIGAAAFGLSALLAASSTAFMLVKLAGAAYLVWMGVAMLLARARQKEAVEETPAPVEATTYPRIFLQGFLTNVLNPKVGLFFLAFMPQFIDADAPNKALAFLFLGAVFNFNSILWTQGLAWFTAAASQRVRLPGAVTRWLNRAIGVLFVSFGLRLALAK